MYYSGVYRLQKKSSKVYIFNLCNHQDLKSWLIREEGVRYLGDYLTNSSGGIVPLKALSWKHILENEYRENEPLIAKISSAKKRSKLLLM